MYCIAGMLIDNTQNSLTRHCCLVLLGLSFSWSSLWTIQLWEYSLGSRTTQMLSWPKMKLLLIPNALSILPSDSKQRNAFCYSFLQLKGPHTAFVFRLWWGWKPCWEGWAEEQGELVPVPSVRAQVKAVCLQYPTDNRFLQMGLVWVETIKACRPTKGRLADPQEGTGLCWGHQAHPWELCDMARLLPAQPASHWSFWKD